MVAADHFLDAVDTGVRIAGACIQLGRHHAIRRFAPVHVEGAVILEFEGGKVGRRIEEHIAARGKDGPAEAGGGRMDRLVGPRQIVMPGLYPRITEYRSAVDVADLPRPEDVVQDLVVVESEVARHVPVPRREIGAAVKVGLVILPHADNRRD